MSDNTISVIITSYNLEGIVSGTVRAVMAQTWRDLEIIIVDDGSTDGTREELEALAKEDQRIKLIFKENGGAASARLAGFREASGGWITTLDGDDIPEENMYERLLLNAMMYSSDISHGSYRMVFPDRTEDFYGTGKLLVQDSGDALTDLISGEFIEPQLGVKLFRRELFEGLENELDLTVRYLEDLLMGFYLFRKAKRCVYEDVCLLNYIKRPGSLSLQSVNPHLIDDPLRVTRIILYETADSEKAHAAAEEKYLRRLIYNATGYTGKNRRVAAPFARSAVKELRKVRKEALSWNITSRLKVMVRWCSFWPGSYRAVHAAYAKIKKIDRRYDI